MLVITGLVGLKTMHQEVMISKAIKSKSINTNTGCYKALLHWQRVSDPYYKYLILIPGALHDFGCLATQLSPRHTPHAWIKSPFHDISWWCTFMCQGHQITDQYMAESDQCIQSYSSQFHWKAKQWIVHYGYDRVRALSSRHRM